MGGLLTVLPLAVVMIGGPQIISAVFLATSVDWARNSVAYVAGAALSITLVVTLAYLVVRGAKGSAGTSSKGSEGQTLDAVLLALLVFAAVSVLPAILVVVMGDRAQRFLPTVREWMNTNSWIVSELVIALFIGIEINSLASA